MSQILSGMKKVCNIWSPKSTKYQYHTNDFHCQGQHITRESFQLFFSLTIQNLLSHQEKKRSSLFKGTKNIFIWSWKRTKCLDDVGVCLHKLAGDGWLLISHAIDNCLIYANTFKFDNNNQLCVHKTHYVRRRREERALILYIILFLDS